MKTGSTSPEPRAFGDCSVRLPAEPQAFEALRRFTRVRENAERCELCGAELGDDHQHLWNRSSRQVTCSCDSCAILFCGQGDAKYLRIPRRVVRLDGFYFTAEEWDSMMLPINLAFFTRRSTNDGVTALYPSPAGAMESMVELPSWSELFGREAVLASVQPHVEGLLVNRMGEEARHFLTPVDTCYRLIGLIRTRWRGLSGGTEVWRGIAEFFEELDRRAKSDRKAVHA